MNLHHMLRAAAGYSVPAPPASTDPQFNYVTMLLHGDGTNGAQNNTFVDSSTNNFTITRNGTPTQGSFSPYGDLWSNFFNGTTDYISAPANAAFNFGTGEFTAECWCYLTSRASMVRLFAQTGFSISNVSILFEVATSGVATAYVATGSTYISATGSGSVPLNTWTHVAMVRDVNTLRLYVNGVQSGSASMTGVTVPSCTSPFIVGRNGDYNANYVPGYISNMRVVKGSCVYPSGTTFTPSTTPLTAVSGTSLLTCQSNRFRDNSSNNFAITVTGTPSVQRFSPFDPAAEYSTSVIGGSGYFSGSGQYLTVPYNTSMLPESGINFTAECWIYLTGATAAFQLILGMNSSTQSNWSIRNENGSLLGVIGGSFGTLGTPVANTWMHLAIVQNSNTLVGYLNGVQAFSQAITSWTSTSLAVSVGARSSSGDRAFPGYISNVRIVKGTAVYTAAFTPPTAPLTAITNTSLLLNTVNAGIFDNAMMNDLVTVGNAQVSTAVKKYGTGSMAFDGSGDYLTTPTNSQLQFGTGDFTVEFWLYFISRDTLGACIFANYNSFTTGALSFFAGHNTGSATKYQVACNGTFPAIQSTATVTYNQWDHFAVVRSGSTLTLYVNGVANGTFNVSGVSLNGVGSNWIFGAALDAPTNYELNGYIDDLRITKGIARYTANFTPPTAAFPNN